MIDIAKANALKEKSDTNFEVASVFDYEVKHKYDLISAMGFIEYISQDELKSLLNFSYKNLSGDGSICIDSRNRLFNITTFNSYTNMEIELEVTESLLKESEVILSSNSNSELVKNLRSFNKNNNLIQNERHPKTNIEVETRYQFTPSDLLNRIENAGFKVKNIYPINYHAFNPLLSGQNYIVNLRKEISELVSSKYQTFHQFLPNSSSFVIQAQKCR